jgi:hypothetical protein
MPTLEEFDNVPSMIVTVEPLLGRRCRLLSITHLRGDQSVV